MIADRIKVLLSQENSTAYGVKNYLRNHMAEVPVSEPVDDVCRLKMVDWLYTIVDTCKLSRQAVPIAMSFVDRHLSNPRGGDTVTILEDRSKYQLLIMT